MVNPLMVTKTAPASKRYTAEFADAGGRTGLLSGLLHFCNNFDKVRDEKCAMLMET